jgi:LuxR family maltose regulon positive regulatory protein
VHILGEARQIQTRLPALRKRLRRLTSTVPLPPPHLDIRAFGKAQVRVNGRVVTNAQWQSRSVCELFFYFLHASDAVTKEQIGIDLWPEVTTAQLKLRFKNNLYRLRRALGPETILRDGELYCFNRDLDFEYDVEAFESHLEKARTSNGIHERIQHYQEAVDLVRGPYLNDIGSLWSMPEQERLAQEHVRALLSLTKLLLQIEKNEEAFEACRRALVCDPSLEEAHRFAMRIYELRGDRSAVLRQYQACRNVLQAEYGADPSVETEALYRKLTS